MTAAVRDDQLAGRAFALRPVVPDDYSALYAWSTTPPSSVTWRFAGSTPSPDQFVGALWEGVLAQFTIIDPANRSAPVGLVQAFNYDTQNRIAYYGVLVDPQVQRSSTAMAEATFLFVRYLFRQFDLRKVYAETTELALDGVARIISSWDCVTEEGRLRQHAFVDGRHVDLVVLAIYRDAFLEDSDRVARLVSEPQGRSQAGLPSFEAFVERLPHDLLPRAGEIADLTGGTNLAEDLGVDSLGLLELTCWAEDEFRRQIAIDRLVELVTLQDLYGALESG